MIYCLPQKVQTPLYDQLNILLWFFDISNVHRQFRPIDPRELETGSYCKEGKIECSQQVLNSFEYIRKFQEWYDRKKNGGIYDFKKSQDMGWGKFEHRIQDVKSQKSCVYLQIRNV